MPRPKRNRERRERRRKVKIGYPIIDKFTDIKDVNDYLSGDHIICLLCGRSLKRLAGHLTRIHKMTIDEYKIKYGIPWRRGLLCQEAHQNYSDALHKRIDEGNWDYYNVENRKKANNAPHRKRCAAVLNIGSKAILGYMGRDKPFEDEDYLKVFDLMVEKQCGLVNICNHNDMPSFTAMYEWINKHPDRKLLYDKTCDILPYPIQAKSEKLGPRFKTEVNKLFHEQKIPMREIVKITGVSLMSVWGVIEKRS